MIEICTSKDRFYIWNAADACLVRQEHHIVGTLVGCLPHLPNQNIQLGLPLQLSKWEVQLLLEKGFAKLRSDADQCKLPTNEEVEAFKLLRQRTYTEQLEACKLSKQKMMRKNLDRIVLGKKRKMESTKCSGSVVDLPSKKKRKKLLATACNQDTTSENSDRNDIRELVEDQIDSLSIPVTLPDSAVCVQIHTATYRQKQDEENTVTEWNYDNSPRDELLYRVFLHFWELGYFLTSGAKFGGDFLIYPGDPSRYHSLYIAVCVAFTEPLPAIDIVAHARLATDVKKTVILCCIDDSGLVCHKSLQWTGIK